MTRPKRLPVRPTARRLAYLPLVLFLVPAFAQDQSGTRAPPPGQTAPDARPEDPADPSSRVRRLGDSLTVDPRNEWLPGMGPDPELLDLERKLEVADRALANGDLVTPPEANALYFYRQVLAADPGNARARAGVQQVSDALMADALQAQRTGDLEGALRGLARLREVQPDYPGMRTLEDQITARMELEELLVVAAARLEAGSLTRPAGESALDAFRAVLAIDAQNEEALAGLERILADLLTRARAAAEQGDLDLAEDLTEQAAAVEPESPELAMIREQLAAGRQVRWREQILGIERHLASGELDAAERSLAALQASGHPDEVRRGELAARIARLRRVRAYAPGSSLRDTLAIGADGPRMVVLGAGTFEMGSPRGERGRAGNEGPLREVTFALPFAIARTETTVGEFRRFAEAAGYVTDAERTGSSTIYNVLAGSLKDEAGVDWRSDFQGQPARDDEPVVHVSWNDARAYAQWLSEQTGASYRLPTEAEFEYALRAGTDDPYWWGRGAPAEVVENLTGEGDRMAGRWQWPDPFRRYDDGHWGPAPVASFQANPFGLFDMGGNVLEWTEDCYAADLSEHPGDGSPRSVAGCRVRTLRGGSWATPPERSRSAHRSSAQAERATCLVGFRVVRDL